MAIAKRVCTACGEAKKPNIDFYLSRSKLYKFNDARMPICKECLSNLFKELNAKYSDETKALYHLCMLFDIYFSKELVEKSNSNNNYGEEDNLLKTYMKNINSLRQYKFESSMSSDCIILDESLIKNNNLKEDTVLEDVAFIVDDKMKTRCGTSFPL